MYYIIYLSAGTQWFDETELRNILAISHVNNSRNNITGLLLYGEGNFIQLLEGEEAIVQQTFERISADPRHTGITHIAGGTLNERNFPAWSMGFKSIDAASLTTFEGYFKPVNENELPAGKEAHIGINLLKAFIRTAKLLPSRGTITPAGQ
jgi:hypothetical protein